MKMLYETILTRPNARENDVVRLANGTEMYRFQLSDALDMLDASPEVKYMIELRHEFERRGVILLDNPTPENEKNYSLALARYSTAKKMCRLTFSYNAIADVLKVDNAKEMPNK